jgi:RNA polymerase sigma-70 factor (ECF subfamily)
MTHADDQQLLHAATLGDRKAFEAFVERHQDSVFRFLRAVASDHADAEDALQETFLAVWRSAGTYRGGPSARGWVLTIARNALARAHRRRAGQPTSFLPLGELGLQAGWGADGDGILERIARRDLLERALESLGADDREVLVLRELEDLSGGEVADMLGIGVPAMKSRLHRARLRLMAALREVDDDA